MNKTMFDKVAAFHELAGHPVNSEGEAKLPDIKVVRFREDFKMEELIEGIQALGDTENSVLVQETIYYLQKAQACWRRVNNEDLNPDLVEYADSLADLVYVTLGAGHCYNMDMDKIFTEVHNKNLTRFPKNDEELKATLGKAESEGVEVTYSFNYGSKLYVVNRNDNDKVYKNAFHKLPNLLPVIADDSTSNSDDSRVVHCSTCGNWGVLPVDMPRRSMQNFELIGKNVGSGEDVYRCYCGAYVAYKTNK